MASPEITDPATGRSLCLAADFGHTGVRTGSHIVHLVIVKTFGDNNVRMGSTRFNGGLIAQVMPA